jgi:RES domain-containing protein
LRIYRLGRAEFRNSLWSGEGGLHVDGRWHTAGRSVVYAAQSLSLSQLEVLVHISDRRQLPPLVYGEADIPDGLVIDAVDIGALPENWRRFAPCEPDTQRIGTEWLQRQSSAVLKVPSAISIDEWNFLFNPAHEDFSKIKLAAPKVFTMDPRLS